MLIAAYQNNKIRSDFMSSLSIAGVDGTLGNRLKADVLKGNVKGKTGTLSDVSALAGYLETRAKNMVAFTILVNGPAAGAGGYFAMQEKLLLDIYESY
ncbi:MAG: D-alanyl-D-alanine carboxypeptidase/D-alanyl-D-alanine-endopeptidase [uncultured bacterium]|nr:MAG: D-alanyl-D-alanine carboxypeptidase/D-alanyl-D-alanine-endopeptidase [uncultured bacterium]